MNNCIYLHLIFCTVGGGRQAAQPDVMEELLRLPGVRVVPRSPELDYRQEHSRVWNETWLAAFFHKPCNHELFVRQSLNMEGAAAAAPAPALPRRNLPSPGPLPDETPRNVHHHGLHACYKYLTLSLL